MSKHNENPIKNLLNERDSANSVTQTFSASEGGAERCEHPLRAGDHPENSELNKKFILLYQLGNFNDDSLAGAVGVQRTTINRYRRGVWIPNSNLKLKICKVLTERLGKYIAVEMIWGDMILEDQK